MKRSSSYEDLPPQPEGNLINPAEGKDRLNNSLGYFLISLALGLSASALGPTLPGLAEQTQVGLGQISSLFTFRAIGVMLGSLLGGRLFDHRPGHPILQGSLALTALLLTLIPNTRYLWLLVLILFVIGIVEGFMNVGINTLLLWQHGVKAGPYLNTLHFCFGVGSFIAPILVGQAISHWNISSLAFYGLALFFLPVLGWMLRLPSPVRHTSHETNDEIKSKLPLILLITFFLFLYVGGEVAYSGWITTYALTEKLANPATAAYVASAFWAAITLGRLLSIPLVVRFRPGQILLVDLLGALAGLGTLLVLPGSYWLLVLASAWAGLFMASVFSTILNLSSRRITVSGKVTSIFFIGSSLGSSFLPWLVGQLFVPIGPRVLIGVVFLNFVIALIVLAAVERQPSKI